MIRISMTRDRDREHFDQGSRLESVPRALRLLLDCEFGYGGDIVDASINPARLTTETRVLSCVDRTVFEGSADEMRPLMMAARFYARASGMNELVCSLAADQLQQLPNGQGGVPLIISMLTPNLIGGNRMGLALMYALGVSEESQVQEFIQRLAPDLLGRTQTRLMFLLCMGVTEEADLREMQGCSLDDLVTAIELMQENPGMSFREIVGVTRGE